MPKEMRIAPEKPVKRITGRITTLKLLYKGEYFTKFRSPSDVSAVYLIHRAWATGELLDNSIVYFAMNVSSGKLVEFKGGDVVYEHVPSKELEMRMLPYTA